MLAAVTSGSKAYWYLTRATGVVTLLLLTASVVLGILQVTRWSSRRWPRFVTAGLHKNISLLVVVFLAVHITTAVLDTFAPIRWLDAVVPFRSAYRPIWLGLGAVACDLLIALVITSLLRTRVGYPAWRAVHWLAYACWPVALVHGLGTGSDTRQPWALGIVGLSIALVAGATWWRIGQAVSVPVGRRVLAASGVAMTILVTALFTYAGPLQHSWARHAGTPPLLLPSTRLVDATAPPGPAAPVTTPPSAAAPISVPFAGSLEGSLTSTKSTTSGRTTVVIDAELRGGATGRVHLVLEGQTLGDGGVSLERSRAYLGTRGVPALFSGTITGLQGMRVVARLSDATGRRIELTLDLAGSDSTLTGHVAARNLPRASA